MVRATVFGRRGGLPGGLLAVCVCWAVVVFGALPALAHADEPLAACPAGEIEIPEEMPQPEREVRALRNDVASSCAAQLAALGALVPKLEGVREGLTANGSELAAIAAALTAEAGLPVRLAGQSGPLETTQAGGGVGGEAVTVSNLEGVEQAVLTDSETVNSALWGIAGLFVGVIVLAVVFKLVRP